MPSSAAPPRSSPSTGSSLGVPEVVVEDVRAAMGPAAARYFGDPTARAAGGRHHGHEREDDDRVPHARDPRARRDPDGAARHGQVDRGRHRGAGRAHDAGGDRPAGHVQADARRGRPRVRDGGVLARARARPGGGDPVRLPRVHEPHAGPPRLPSGHGGLLPGQAAPVRRRGPRGRERGRRLRPPASPPSVPDAITYAVERPAAFRARDVRFDPAGSSFTCETPEGELDVVTRLPGLFNVQNALAALAAAHALGVDLETRSREALADAARVPGRFEPVDEGQAFTVLVDYAHTPEALENVLRAARELTDGPRARRLRRRRRPRPREAAADGPGGRDARRPRDRDLRQSPLRGSGGDHRRDPRGHRARASSARPTAAARSRGPSRAPLPATWSSWPARGTSRDRSSRAAARSRSTT